MALGTRRDGKQQSLWIARDSISNGPAHIFYEKLNEFLRSIDFDDEVECLCQPYYARNGRPGIAPGVYFRMTLIGYFENISSQRGIAWRCQDSLSLRRFLGIDLDERTPVHASMTNIRQRLPLDVHQAVFDLVLGSAGEHLLFGGVLAVDSTTLEANAAMKSIKRRDTHEDYPAYIERLMREEGVIDQEDSPSAEQRMRFDRQRKGKKLSNVQWQSGTDPDARIMKMKDGRTRLGYKAEHAVELDSDIIVSAKVYFGDQSDAETLTEAVVDAGIRFKKSAVAEAVKAVVADKGYHNLFQLDLMQSLGVRSYIATPQQKGRRRWVDKPVDAQRQYTHNARRNQGDRGKALHRARSEQGERSFAQVCTTGGGRRSWLRGLENINKRYLIIVAAHNLATIMRALFGVGKPREWAERVKSAILRILTGTDRLTRHLFFSSESVRSDWRLLTCIFGKTASVGIFRNVWAMLSKLGFY